jgi:dTDP-4-amino-4,6-dideoxygalactose transaminase
MMQMHQSGLELNLNANAVSNYPEKQEIQISVNDYDAFDPVAQQAEKLVISCRENARFLINQLNKYAKYLELPQVIDDVLYLALSIRVKNNAPFEKEDLIKHLSDAGIETRSNFGFLPTPNHLSQAGKNNRLPVASDNHTNRFCIPCHHFLTIPNLQHIVSQFDTFFEQWCTEDGC